jgi:erythronate-4-phosphate dehydrogenase
MKLNIVADENMPLVEEYFSDIGTVSLVNGRTLSQTDLQQADLLLVRSVTQVNQALLQNTPVKFVGTATIGTDHIDQQYLKTQNIHFASAPGCNANSVAEYILSALLATDRIQELINNHKTLAIVGLGNVGSIVAKFASILGIDYVCYDPLQQFSGALAEQDQAKHEWCSWQQVLEADVISLHVPLTTSGSYPTEHMFSEAEFQILKPSCLLINTSRGAVIDNHALLSFLTDETNIQTFDVILDVWENEPNINLQLRDLCVQHTPHIAGYSVDGKRNGTEMIYRAALLFLKSRPVKTKIGPENLTSVEWSKNCDFIQNLKKCVYTAYNITNDSQSLAALTLSNIQKSFDLLRQNYPDRLEFEHYIIEAVPRPYKSLIQALGFQVASPILESNNDN